MTVAVEGWSGRWFDAWVEEGMAAACPFATLERLLHQRAGGTDRLIPINIQMLTDGGRHARAPTTEGAGHRGDAQVIDGLGGAAPRPPNGAGSPLAGVTAPLW